MNRIFPVVALLSATFALVACDPDSPSAAQQAKRQNIAAQQDIIVRATSAVPVPSISNFLARENLAEYMRRMDDPAKTWYVYEYGDTGSAIGYFVSSTYPQSICTFMTPPEEVNEVRVGGGSGPNPISVTTAPALDGVYYGKGGCETKFFFDVSSGAMILTDNRLRASDAPLSTTAPQIKITGPVSGKAGDD